MPRGKRLFELVVTRVRGSKKGSSYVRKFKTAAEREAARGRYAKIASGRKSRSAPKQRRPKVAKESHGLQISATHTRINDAIVGRFIPGSGGQVGVEVFVKGKGWLPAPGKVNIGQSAGMSVRERERHVMNRVSDAFDRYKEGVKTVKIKYGVDDISGGSKQMNFDVAKSVAKLKKRRPLKRLELSAEAQSKMQAEARAFKRRGRFLENTLKKQGKI